MATQHATDDLDVRTSDRGREHRDERHTRSYTETKLATKTTEFYALINAIVAIVVATYADSGDTLTKSDGIRYASFVAAAYILSRGLAKFGTREPYTTD
jgi:hypothetical protein